MKTREQIYGQEAAGILRDVSMYHALTETQLLKLYPHKENKIRNLLSYLQKQDRMVLCGEYYRIPSERDDEVYEIIYVEPGKEQLINQMLSTVKEVPPKYIILVEHPEQIAAIHTPNTGGYCTVSSSGEVQYYQIE